MIRLEGIVKERRPDGQYDVEIKYKDKSIILKCYLSGTWRYRYKRGRILIGDKVLIEVNPYDKTRGKIIRKVR